MGIGNLVRIADNLIANGRPSGTPVAVIQRGTTPEQRTLVGTLGDIGEKALQSDIKPPGIIVVGEIVKLRNSLNWFESMPLFGRRIVVTRAREQSSGFLGRLAELGAECIEFPTIETVPPEDWEPLDEAIRSLENYHWLLFTSVNGVKAFFKRLDFLGRDVRDLKGIKLGAIGPKTAAAIHEKGLRPDLVPDEYRAEAVVSAFKRESAGGLRILLPRAAVAREVLPEELAKMGVSVDVVTAYRTVKPKNERDRVKEMLEAGDIHMVTFTSSSTVRFFVEMFEAEGVRLKQWMKKTVVACIGPITAKTAETYGFNVNVTPREYTVAALADEIVRYFSGSH
jgi:uroporphyrinogen III methyltransferase/synthase